MRECLIGCLTDGAAASLMLETFSRVQPYAPQCKAAYAGQTSGYCLSKLPAPPTTSPTTSDFTVDFWYPGKSIGGWNEFYWLYKLKTFLTDRPPP